MTIRWESGVASELIDRLDYREAKDAILDSRGRTVRCTPRRRVTMFMGPDGDFVFRKWRLGRGASREWFWLADLARRGFRVPSRVCIAECEGASVVACSAVPGRPMGAFLSQARHDPFAMRQAEDYCIEVVAPMVRRLHGQGLVFRDLYWDHLFVTELSGEGEPWLIDVERVFRPRWRHRRWIIKDLAGLASSLPSGFPKVFLLRCFRAYRGGLDSDWKADARAILAKEARIRAHRPRYG